MPESEEVVISFSPYPQPKVPGVKRDPRRRRKWREQIYSEFKEHLAEKGRKYLEGQKLEVEVEIYMSERQLRFHDVDNLLKDIFDALQGRLGGPKGVRLPNPPIPNDHQIYKVCIVKKRAPEKADGRGVLKIRDHAVSG